MDKNQSPLHGQFYNPSISDEEQDDSKNSQDDQSNHSLETVNLHNASEDILVTQGVIDQGPNDSKEPNLKQFNPLSIDFQKEFQLKLPTAPMQNKEILDSATVSMSITSPKTNLDLLSPKPHINVEENKKQDQDFFLPDINEKVPKKQQLNFVNDEDSSSVDITRRMKTKKRKKVQKVNSKNEVHGEQLDRKNSKDKNLKRKSNNSLQFSISSVSVSPHKDSKI